MGKCCHLLHQGYSIRFKWNADSWKDIANSYVNAECARGFHWTGSRFLRTCIFMISLKSNLFWFDISQFPNSQTDNHWSLHTHFFPVSNCPCLNGYQYDGIGKQQRFFLSQNRNINISIIFPWPLQTPHRHWKAEWEALMEKLLRETSIVVC